MLKVLSYLKHYKWTAIFATIFIVINSAMQLILPSMMANIMNNGIANGKLAYIYIMGFLMIIAAIFGVFAAVLSSYFSSKASTGFGKELRRAVFLKAESLSQCDIDKIGVSSMITRSTNDINQIQSLVLVSMRMIISAPIMMVGGAIMAFTMNKTLSLVIFTVIPIIALIALFVVKKVLPWFEQMQKKTDALNQIVRERLGGVRVIRAFNKQSYEQARFRKGNFELTEIALKTNRLFASLIPLAMFLMYSLIVILIWLGSSQVNNMDINTQAAEIAGTIGNLQAFMMYLIMIVFAVGLAASMFVMVPRAAISARRICEILDMEPMIKENKDSVHHSDSHEGKIEFKNVSFGYDGAERNVLNNISFTANPSEVTAIIGGTGCGKTTLVNLISRFYDVSSGEILVDGTNIKDMKLSELHKKIGYVPQKVLLFSGTVADNLRYGKEDATEEEMWTALETAQASDFVSKMPKKLESRLSQNATNLSGGQKQRISIARALIRNAEIYIFDDSFSALDFKTDALLRASIKKEFSNSTQIIVAQRVGTILNADKIIVLDNGEIAGQGTHGELYKNCSVYREIVQSQLSKEEIE